RTRGRVVRVGFDGARMFAAARGGIDVWQTPGRRPTASLPARLAVDGAFAHGWFAAMLQSGAAALTRGNGGELALPPPGVRAVFRSDTRVALFAGGHSVALVPVAGGKPVKVHAPGRVTDARFAPDGAFAIATTNGKVGVYDARGRVRFVLDAGSAPLVAVTFSRDGALVAAAGRDGIARIWSARTGRLQHALRRARTPLTDVEFSPDGRYLATAAIGGEAKLWTVADGRLIHILRGHTGRVARVAFRPDSYWLLTAGPTSVGLWQTSTGRLLLYLRGHTDQVEDVAFAPDGHRILTGSADRTLRLYICEVCGDVYQLAELAHDRLTRISSLLTVRERKRYLGG